MENETFEITKFNGEEISVPLMENGCNPLGCHLCNKCNFGGEPPSIGEL